MIPINDLGSSKIEQAELLAELAKRAVEFLTWHRDQCKLILEGWFDRGFAKLGVFHFLYHSVDDTTERVWVIVGDAPPGCIDGTICPNGAAALDAYCACLLDWVDAVEGGKSLEELFPVRYTMPSYELVPPSRSIAKMIRKRVHFIERELLSQWQDERDLRLIEPGVKREQ